MCYLAGPKPALIKLLALVVLVHVAHLSAVGHSDQSKKAMHDSKLRCARPCLVLQSTLQ